MALSHLVKLPCGLRSESRIMLLAAYSLFVVVWGLGNVGSAGPSPLRPMATAFKPWACLLHKCLPNGTAAEQMLAWLKSVFPVNLSALNFQEEFCVLRDIYAVFLSGTVSKLCMAVTVKSMTVLPPLGGVCFGVTRTWHNLITQTLSLAFLFCG